MRRFMRGRGGYVDSWLILAMFVFFAPGRELVVAAPAALRAFVRDERAYQIEKMWRAQFFRLNDRVARLVEERKPGKALLGAKAGGLLNIDLELLEKARTGDMRAQFELGEMYETGDGAPPDYKEAVRWYNASAEQGYSEAQFNLGAMFEKGRGVKQDALKAVIW